MSTFSVNVDLASLAQARVGLEADKRRLHKVIYRTVNDTARHVRSDISKDVRAILPLKKRLVDSHIRLRYAGPKQEDPHAEVTIRDGKPLSLRLFKARQTKKGVTVLLDKRAGRTLEAGAFGPRIALLGRAVFRRKGKRRLPIQKLTGPGVWETMDRQQIDDAARASARDYLPRRLDQRLRLEFG